MKNIQVSSTILLLIGAVLLAGCTGHTNQQKKHSGTVQNPRQGKWQDQSTSPIKFTQNLTIGNQKNLILSGGYHIQGPVADKKGNIYFIDGKKGMMYSFSPQGKLRWKKGEKGKGPGDFSQPHGLAINGNRLYTANVQGSRIDEFNLQGDLINSTPLDKLDLNFVSVNGFIADSLLVTTSTLMGTLGEKISVLNTNNGLTKTSHFKIIPNPELKFSKHLGEGLNIQIIDSLIAAGNNGNYVIHWYNKNGDKVKTISRNFDKLVLFGHYQTSSGSAGIGGFGSLSAPVDLHNGYYLVPLSWTTNVSNPNEFLKKSIQNRQNSQKAIYKNAFDLYRSDGTLLYSETFDGRTPAIGSIAYVDSRGNLYTTSDDPFPQIRRYHVAINAPGGEKY